MKRRNKVQVLILLSTLVFVGYIYGQENDNPFSRTQALLKDGVVYFNVDGIKITAQKKDADFSAKNCINEFPHLKIKKKQLTTDSLLGFQNYYVFKSIEKPQHFFSNIAYYFVHSPDDYIIAFTFKSINKRDKEFERNFISLACNHRIPQNIYHSTVPDNFNFAGRIISSPSHNCKWLGVNNIQCPQCGQMNWSIHKDFDDALATVNNQFVSVSSRERMKIISDTIVNVIFEEVETSARKVIYNFTEKRSHFRMPQGNRSIPYFGPGLGISLTFYIYLTPAPSHKLMFYFVAAPVRGNFVSCVLSFWENDPINSGGLPPLLEQVMKLK